jgi:hypothetical protein
MDIDIDVTIINPADGMSAVREVKAAGGEFNVANLDDSLSVYILRVDYKDVHYDYPVRPAGADPAEITAYIYEQTATWKNVEVTASRLTAARHGDHLQIDRVYEITNKSQPPVTLVGRKAHFKISLPEDMSSFNGLYASALGIPVEREPIETNEPGVFQVDYPIRPGVTLVGLSYTVPYNNSHYAHTEAILYDIDNLTVFSDDPDMRITSESVELVGIEDPHAAAAYVVDGLKRAGELHLHISGGSGSTAGESRRGPVVQIVPNATEDLSFIVMAILLVALLTLAGIALGESKSPANVQVQLERHKKLLLKRMAKLDDLHETQAVPAAAYHAKRTELKNQLASLIYQLKSNTPARHGNRPAKGERRRKK